MPKRKRKPAAPPKFTAGDHVRVKHGIKDVDYPDMPLGGWAGAISHVHKKGRYTVRWNQETLEAIHPVFKSRCERDGLDFEEYGFGEDELEPDLGGPLCIEQPTNVVPRPLDPKNQDDRVRVAFGLTSDGPLPDANDETLLTYHQYLAANLSFPFDAEHGAEYGHPERVKVIGLGDPDDGPMIDQRYGVLCEARLEGCVVTLPLGELEDAKPNRRLVADYCYWFGNW